MTHTKKGQCANTDQNKKTVNSFGTSIANALKAQLLERSCASCVYFKVPTEQRGSCTVYPPRLAGWPSCSAEDFCGRWKINPEPVGCREAKGGDSRVRKVFYPGRGKGMWEFVFTGYTPGEIDKYSTPPWDYIYRGEDDCFYAETAGARIATHVTDCDLVCALLDSDSSSDPATAAACTLAHSLNIPILLFVFQREDKERRTRLFLESLATEILYERPNLAAIDMFGLFHVGG